MLAGLAVGNQRNCTVEAALRLGVACGAANCLRPELGMLRRADVEMLLPRVEMNSVAIAERICNE
jgi:fructose-1-phosphate kinase PfkB-like protein